MEETTFRVPYFDNAEIPFDKTWGTDAPRPKAGLERLFHMLLEAANPAQTPLALTNFLKLTAVDRLKDSRHLYAYYLDYSELIGDYEMHIGERRVIPTSPEDIWNYVTPLRLWLKIEAGVEYVMCDCNCWWDIEHGVQLVWKEGRRLTKVSSFDDSPTHHNAPETVVYYGGYVTHLD